MRGRPWWCVLCLWWCALAAGGLQAVVGAGVGVGAGAGPGAGAGAGASAGETCAPSQQHAHLRCAARAPVALVARLRSATPDRRVCTFQVRLVLRAQGADLAPNDTFRVQVARSRATPLRVDSIYLLLGERVGTGLKLLEPPLLQRCLPKGFKVQLRRAYKNLPVSKHCKANEEYKECGTKCPVTCDNRHNCTKLCVPGCFCKPGFIKDQGECVPSSKTRQNYRGPVRLDLKPREQRVIARSRVQLICRFQGVQPLQPVSWYKDNRKLYLKNNPRISVHSKKRGFQLVISDTKKEDSGLYECRYPRYHSLPANVTVNDESVTMESSCPMKDPSSFCMNGGTCLYYHGVGLAACRCKDDYQGERCEKKVVSTHSSRYTYNCKLGLTTSYYC